MTYPDFRIRVPGKLMIAGEYAVLEHDQKAIVTAIDRYVTVTVSNSKVHQLDLPDLGFSSITWRYVDGGICFNQDDPKFNFIEHAMSVVYQYIEDRSIFKRPFRISVKSELDHYTGKKYGLGSSAAVVVGVVFALLRIAHKGKVNPSRDIIFKLAVIAHFQAQGSGSGADVAASTHGGCLSYTSFDLRWLSTRLMRGDPLQRIIKDSWPTFSVSRLKIPPEMTLCVGWTGKPALTKALIQNIQRFQNAHPKLYCRFLQESAQAVSEFIQGTQTNHHNLLLKAMMRNREALQKLGRYADVPIETLRLATLANLAEQYGGAGKPSGAGAGDCGIALVQKARVESLKKAWGEMEIEPLPIKVNEMGVTLM